MKDTENRKACRWCKNPFVFKQEDLSFYEKILMSPPTLCPECRERRRLVWRNERHFYRRECGMCHAPILAIYPPESEFPVYCETCFWSDRWDPRSFGREFDSSRPFFEQMSELQRTVPRLAITHVQSTNSDYTLNSMQNKNCYMTSGADYNEDCLYGINTQRSKDCVDHYLIYDCERCYSCLDSTRLYQCIGCQECEECSDSWFLYDCKGCTNCAFSANLRNKQYVLFNKQLSKEEYQAQLKKILETLFKSHNWVGEHLQKVKEQAVHRASLQIGSENVSGNYIRHSKNSQFIFDAENLQDCKFVYYGLDARDSYDQSCVGFKCELNYELMSATNAYHCFFSNAAFFDREIHYSILCTNSSNLFGCIALNRQEYCILNKQYSREDFEKLRQTIIAHMKKTNEYGEFFPPHLSAFEYNRSAAIDYMPLTKEKALSLGFKWYESAEQVSASNHTDSENVCQNCGKPFRLTVQELDFYQKINIPSPHFCWACRLTQLIQSRRPRKIFDSNCKKCGRAIQTSFSSDRPATVYCEKCYLEAVY